MFRSSGYLPDLQAEAVKFVLGCQKCCARCGRGEALVAPGFWCPIQDTIIEANAPEIFSAVHVRKSPVAIL